MIYVYTIGLFIVIMTIWYNTADYITPLFYFVILIVTIIIAALGIIDAIDEKK